MTGGRRLSLTAALLACGLGTGASAAQVYQAGSPEDPRVRAAIYLGSDQRYYSAITELLRLQRGDGAGFEASPVYWSDLAEYELSFGMRDRAESIYRNVAVSRGDPTTAGRARLRMAEFEFQRGYYDEARATLLRAREKLPAELELAWMDLYGRVLLAQGRYNDAADVLAQVSGSADAHAFLRYNLGIALINAGRLAEGRTALDRVGRHPGDSPLISTLRDKANVALGWNFLQSQLGGSAKAVLIRVRANGPYSNRALLGVGWSEVAGEGERQLRGELEEDRRLRALNDPLGNESALSALLRGGYLSDPYDRAGIRTFRRSRLGGDEEERLRRALVVWIELAGRDPQDPAVQESWLAVPFALDRLGAHTQAAHYYEQALERLEAARQRTLAAIKSIKGGGMVETLVRRDAQSESGWEWQLRDLPDMPETYYLQSLLSEHRYAEMLKNYRDLRLLGDSVDAWSARIATMDQALQSTARRPSVEPAQLFASARRHRTPLYDKLDLQLDLARRLSPPGSFGGDSGATPAPLPALQLSAVPAHFDGPYERLQNLKARTANLREPLASAEREAARQLQSMALRELDSQRAQIDKYLVEARFSLARIYDGELPSADQDEFELDDRGNRVTPPPQPNREVEVK